MSIYDTSTLGVTGNKVTFNDFNSSPVYRVIKRRPTAKEIREFDIPLPEESGISDFRTYLGQMLFVIDGKIYPGDDAEYEEAIDALRKIASLDIAQEDANADAGYVPYTFTIGADSRQIFVKVLRVELEEDARQGFVQPFRLVCKVKHPIIKGGDLKTLDTSSVNPTTGGGSMDLPVEVPVVVGASTATVSDTLVNNGDIETYPESIIVNGPVNIPRVTNTTTGEYIEVSTNLATSGDQMIITYDQDTLTVTAGGSSVMNNVSTASTFFKIATGTNTFQLSGSSVGSGAYFKVTMYDAWPLT